MRHIRSYWADEDIDFFFEIGDDGWVQRQVEVERASGRVLAASSLTEWQNALKKGPDAVNEYRRQFGGLADQPVDSWDDGSPKESITADQYEATWEAARRARNEGA